MLALSPYLAGSDLGVIKVPTLPPGPRDALRLLGPLLFVMTVALFFPIWKEPSASEGLSRATGVDTIPGGTRVELAAADDAASLILLAVSRFRRWSVGRRVFYNEAATVVAELALNAFKHGAASHVTLGVYRFAIVLQDNGGPFNPLTAAPRTTGPGGAGLFALNHFLRHSRPPVVADYRYLGDARESDGWNELVLYIDDARSVRAASWPIRLRGPTNSNHLDEVKNFPHLVDLRWGFAHYAYDDDTINKQTYRGTYVISRKSNLVERILERLPPGAVLHLKADAGGMRDAHYRWLANQHPGRVLVDS